MLPSTSATSAEYDAAWQVLVDAVKSNHGHAWRFRNASDEHHVIEFVECDSSADIFVIPAIADALRSLEIIAVSDMTGTWKEWQSWQE